MAKTAIVISYSFVLFCKCFFQLKAYMEKEHKNSNLLDMLHF